MAGHSKFANIKHRKGAQDKKRANLFTKLVREVVVAAKSGLPDPASNPRLRLAVANAKSASVPKDRIEGAIKKATEAGGGEDYEEIRYEGYGTAGVAMIVETLSDNKNRTVTDVRTAFAKNGGNLGESGSVIFTFDRLGYMKFNASIGSEDEVLEAAIEAGADNCESDSDFHEITCAPESLHEVQGFLSEKFGDPESAKLIWKPNNEIEVDLDKAVSIENLIEKLEDLDDVQDVYSNHSYSDEVAEKLAENID